MRTPSPIRAQAISDIRRLVAEHGQKEGERRARDLHWQVKTTTFNDWIRLSRDVAEPPQSVEVAAHPVAPMTQIPANTFGIEQSGWAFDRRIAEMDLAARALIDVAWPIDETGRRGRVKNPMLLKSAHAALAQTAGLVIKHAEGAWNVKLAKEFHEHLYTVILDAIKGEDPKIQHRIAQKVDEAVRDRLVQASHAAPTVVGMGVDES